MYRKVHKKEEHPLGANGRRYGGAPVDKEEERGLAVFAAAHTEKVNARAVYLRSDCPLVSNQEAE